MDRFLTGWGGKARIMSFSSILLVLVCLFSFPACSNVDLEIVDIQSTLILDYPTDTSLPMMRLSAFVQTSSDERKAERIRILHEESGLEWVCNNPRRVGESDKSVWAGYTNFVPATGSVFPQGKYALYYTDMNGDEVSFKFTISYPESLSSTTADLLKSSVKNMEEVIALYDKDGELIFFGPRAENWDTDGDIKNSYGLAQKIRLCYKLNGGAVVCMLPPKDF